MASRWKHLLGSVKKDRYNWASDGVKYGYITYYPRRKDHQDPPFQPTKLLMVHRVKTFKGAPYWDKNTLKRLGFSEESMDPVILKNTPEICAELWRVKHLVKVAPLKLPEKLPGADDHSIGTYLHENGTLYLTPKIDPERYKATNCFLNNPKRFDKETMMEKLRLRWMQGTPIY